MGRRLRKIEPEDLLFVTGRTLQERFFLRPDRPCRELIEYWLGRAQDRWPIEIFEYLFMSNHYHMLVRDPHGNLARFMHYFLGNLAKAINHLRGRRGKFWADRYHMQHVLDDEAAVELALYTLTNPVKDGLVARAAQWPGASSYESTARGQQRVVVHFDRAAWVQAGRPRNKAAFQRELPIVVSPLPPWARMAASRRRKLARELLSAREAALANERRRDGRRMMTKKQLRSVDPFRRPRDPKCSPQPLCHTTDARLRRAFRETWREFNEAYRSAAALVRGGIATIGKAVFPPGSFPPSLPRSWPEPG